MANEQTEFDRIKAELKEKASKKDKRKAMTLLIDPDNAKQLAALKVKGQKSDLVNELLRYYFDSIKNK